MVQNPEPMVYLHLNGAKAGGFQSQGGEGEAVVVYCEPSPTPDLVSSGFPAGLTPWHTIDPILQCTHGSLHQLWCFPRSLFGAQLFLPFLPWCLCNVGDYADCLSTIIKVMDFNGQLLNEPLLDEGRPPIFGKNQKKIGRCR